MINDDNQGPFAMGIHFPFYGNTFDSVRICSNGWISFNSTVRSAANYPLPSTSAPVNLIAPFWDDLDPSAGGQMWYYTNPESTVVSWIDVPYRTTGGPYTFQVVLLSTGGIYFNYGSMNTPLNGATIGIQNAARNIGLQVAYNQAYVHGNMTVKINHSWVTASPGSGVIAAGANSDIVVTCDASSLGAGTYTGSLAISGQDQFHVLAVQIVPVTLHVTPQGIEDNASNMPSEFELSQNYPNPFNPTTEIGFALPTKSFVSLEVFNVLGQKVKTLINADMEAGFRSITWNGTDESGASVTSGIYFYKLAAGNKIFTKKMTFLK